MIYILLNLVPILAATVAGLVLGAFWTRASTHRFSIAFLLLAFVAEFWLASILAGALILAPPQAGEWVMAIGSAVVIWMGFVMPALAVTLAHRRVNRRAILADCGYWLAAMVLQAVVMKWIGLVPPPGAPGT